MTQHVSPVWDIKICPVCGGKLRYVKHSKCEYDCTDCCNTYVIVIEGNY